MALFRKCKLFHKTYAGYANNRRVIQAFNEFIALKSENPHGKFGSKDSRFTAGPLKEFHHAGLTFDVSIIYQIKFENKQTVIYLYGIFSHDESGTGAPANIRKMNSLNTKMGNQVFEHKLTRF